MGAPGHDLGMHDFPPHRLKFNHGNGCRYQVYLFKGIRGGATHNSPALPTLHRIVDPCTLSWRHQLPTYVGLTDHDVEVCVTHSVLRQ